ncbi:MAG: DUF6702 family protein [Chitinophaga sp.]
MGVLLCKWLLPVWFGAVHPFYMSVTEIRYNQPRKSLEVSCRIFTDDLENALKKYNHTSLDLTKPKDRPAADTMIARYLRRHFSLSADGKALPLQYLGYQISEDAVWCFLEHAPMAPFKHLDIHNDVLYAEHDTQGHMIHLIVNDRRKSTKIDNPKAAASFDL